jgi:putative peptidoglycan lipid II flippase
MVGTAIAVVMVPVYVVLRQQAGAIGLALASSAAIMVYVTLLGWLQRSRFEREAAARGATLENSPGMLLASLRLALAAAVAAGLGLVVRSLLLQWLPDLRVTTVLLRATLLCSFGTGTYLLAARLLGVPEVAEFGGAVLRRLRLRGRW